MKQTAVHDASMSSSEDFQAADSLFRDGRLREAITAQTNAVKLDPTSNEKRLFLFELLAFAGDLHRAELQIDAIHYANTEVDAAVQPYRNLLRAEKRRHDVFEGVAKPDFVQEPPTHVRERLTALRILHDGDHVGAATHIATANASCPAAEGDLDGRHVDVLRDCDDLMGPVIEVMCANGGYFWVPMSQIDTISISTPKTPRDLLWASAHLETKGGAAGPVYLPTRYPGSEAHDDLLIRLGRKTDWIPDEDIDDADARPVRGVGLRTFLVDDDAMTLFDWQNVHFA